MDTPEDQSVPPWTLFFEGSLYKKYVDYMKNHDLSKMDRFGVLSNKNSPLIDPPMLSNETNWIPPSYSKHENGNPNYSDHYYDGEKGPSRDSPPPYGAAPYGGQSTSSDTNALTEAQKRRNRHTVGFVFFGILLIGAAAAATALIIHYVFITEHERITDHKLNLINNNTRADLIEDNKDDISIDDLGKIGPKLTTVSPAETAHNGTGSSVDIDVSDPETFSVPRSTEAPVKTDKELEPESMTSTTTPAPETVPPR